MTWVNAAWGAAGDTGAVATSSWQLRAWRAALACFVLAGLTGAVLRFGFLWGLPWSLGFGNVRHAHSHLMFFGWVTPALMALLLTRHERRGAPPAGGRFVVGITLVAALASFVPFLLSGYGRLGVLGRPLPLSMMTAGLNGLAWFAFAAHYHRAARYLARAGSPPGLPDRYASGALALLLLSALGAAGIAAVGMAGGAAQLQTSLVTFFLDLFAEGWFGMALLGLTYAALPPASDLPGARVGPWLLAVALAAAALAELGAANFEVFTGAALAGRAAAGLALLVAVAPLARELAGRPPGSWHVLVGLFAVKAAFDVALAMPAFAAWSDAAGMRVFYLHAYLLAGVSVGLVAAAREAFGPVALRGPGWLVATALLVVASLLPLTGVWPTLTGSAAGRWALALAAWASPGPLLAVTAGLLASGFTRPLGAREPAPGAGPPREPVHPGE